MCGRCGETTLLRSHPELRPNWNQENPHIEQGGNVINRDTDRWMDRL